MTINEDLGTPDPLPTHPLIVPLTDEQQHLVDTLFRPALAPGGSWPVFDFAIRTLRKQGIDAEAELAGMPVAANHTNPMMGYRHVWAEGGGNALPERQAGPGNRSRTDSGRLPAWVPRSPRTSSALSGNSPASKVKSCRTRSRSLTGRLSTSRADCREGAGRRYVRHEPLSRELDPGS